MSNNIVHKIIISSLCTIPLNIYWLTKGDYFTIPLIINKILLNLGVAKGTATYYQSIFISMYTVITLTLTFYMSVEMIADTFIAIWIPSLFFVYLLTRQVEGGTIERMVERYHICAICYDNFNDEIVCKLKCGHIFHANCINAWYKIKRTCPYCRFRIE